MSIRRDLENRISKFSVIFVLVWVLSGCVALITPTVNTKIESLEAGNYRLDPSHTSVLFKVSHMGLSTYVGRFNEFEAALTFDGKHLNQLSLDALINTASVDVNDEALEDTLKNNDWFNVVAFPQARFRSEKVSEVADNRFTMQGTLSLAGQQTPLTLSVTYNGSGYNMLTGYQTVGFQAQGQFSRSALGLDDYIPMIGDTVSLEIHAEFQLVD